LELKTVLAAKTIARRVRRASVIKTTLVKQSWGEAIAHTRNEYERVAAVESRSGERHTSNAA
jgi:hypothetical protein